jgi:D-alanyl-D-alanine carboxypeptidase (penicillin-binding protein 5/6)
MNFYALRLKLSSTNFDSAHGLSNKHNYSTASDICKLSLACMKLPKFREVVNTRYYSTRPLNNDQFKYKWENTNKLLGDTRWVGCKTGVTEPAGPCFSGFYENEEDKYCVVVLHCKSMESRWKEVPRMV